MKEKLICGIKHIQVKCIGRCGQIFWTQKGLSGLKRVLYVCNDCSGQPKVKNSNIGRGADDGNFD